MANRIQIDDPLKYTTSVSIELSNLCQYAWFHVRCPLHLGMKSPFLIREPRILESEIVYRVLDTLDKYGYGREICFHRYNEPLIDPRLFEFIRYARGACPKSEIVILTNGHYLTLVLARELMQAGLSRLIISVYGNAEEQETKRRNWTEGLINQLPADFCYMMGHKVLDERLLFNYEREPLDSERPCCAPLGNLSITKDAELSLCCHDWKRLYIFGNLFEQSLEEILSSDSIWETYSRLSRGDRFLGICRRCPFSRGKEEPRNDEP